MKKPIESRIWQSSLKIYFSFVLALVLTVYEFTQSYCLNSFTKTYLTCVPRITDLDSSPYRSVLPSSPSQKAKKTEQNNGLNWPFMINGTDTGTQFFYAESKQNLTFFSRKSRSDAQVGRRK